MRFNPLFVIIVCVMVTCNVFAGLTAIFQWNFLPNIPGISFLTLIDTYEADLPLLIVISHFVMAVSLTMVACKKRIGVFLVFSANILNTLYRWILLNEPGAIIMLLAIMGVFLWVLCISKKGIPAYQCLGFFDRSNIRNRTIDRPKDTLSYMETVPHDGNILTVNHTNTFDVMNSEDKRSDYNDYTFIDRTPRKRPFLDRTIGRMVVLIACLSCLFFLYAIALNKRYERVDGMGCRLTEEFTIEYGHDRHYRYNEDAVYFDKWRSRLCCFNEEGKVVYRIYDRDLYKKTKKENAN